MNDKDLYWLAGWLEGEGSFLKGPPSSPTTLGISAVSTDFDTITKVANLLETKIYQVKKEKDHYKDVWVCRLNALPARRLMIKLKPLMSIRRQLQIENALSSPLPKVHGISQMDKLEMYNLYLNGITQSAIATQFNCSRESVNKSIKDIRDGDCNVMGASVPVKHLDRDRNPLSPQI